MSASANLVQSNVAAFNSGDNFMLISNSEDNTKKFQNFQSKEIKRIKEMSENLSGTCDDTTNNTITASNSGSTDLYEEVDSEVQNVPEKKIETKYQVGKPAEKKVQFEDSYQEIGAPLESMDMMQQIDQAQEMKDTSQMDDTEDVQEMDDTEDVQEMDDTGDVKEIDDTEILNTEDESAELLVPNTVEETPEEMMPSPEPVAFEPQEQNEEVVEQFTNIKFNLSKKIIIVVAVILLLGLIIYKFDILSKIKNLFSNASQAESNLLYFN